MKAPTTFTTKGEAQRFLAITRAEIERGEWKSDVEKREQAVQTTQATQLAQTTFAAYAEKWISTRTNRKGQPIAQSTRDEYARYLESGYLAHWAERPLTSITAAEVDAWYVSHVTTAPTSTARQYDLMKSIFKTAVVDDLLSKSPCRVKGGSQASAGKKSVVPTDEEMDTIISALSGQYQVVATVAVSAGLRFGEIIALTRDDVHAAHTDDGEVDHVIISVTKAVTHTKSHGRKLKGTKTNEARQLSVYGRDATIIAAYVEAITDGNLFRAAQNSLDWLPYHTMEHQWKSAAQKAGVSCSFHSTRHYAGTRYAQSGATLAEVMSRLGHSTPSAAMKYQHSGTRDLDLAKKAAR